MEGLGEARGFSPETPRFSVGVVGKYRGKGLGEAITVVPEAQH